MYVFEKIYTIFISWILLYLQTALAEKVLVAKEMQLKIWTYKLTRVDYSLTKFLKNKNAFKMRIHRLQRSDPVPPPNGAIVTDCNEHLAISWKGGLSNSSVALWIGKDWWSQRSWIRNCKVPSVDLALGVAKGEGLLLQICWEPDKPDFTVSYVQFVNDGCPLLFLSLTLIKTTRLPNHNAVLTRLGKHKITKPPEEEYIEANIIAF